MARPSSFERTGRKRCAIYTRKSSEEGLEQDFNSLDAQREACAAYILSQNHEGWRASAEPYDDGGHSGGTLARPALQRLLAHVKEGRIDVVVVYKVDRLTRSLADFAKIVEVFDAHRVSFVSVTQQFNTTTSMGRLTLNVLLSFAQFEREVTGERIRDKIAASKKKGMWMGGLPPLGYDVKERKLVVNSPEADTVRHIFQRYTALGSVHALQAALACDGVVSKRRLGAGSRVFGGTALARGALYRMPQNRLYRGEIVHKEAAYPAEHPAIIEADLWNQAQATLAANRVAHRTGAKAETPSLLAGLLSDEHGASMTPSHAVKKGRRYRYYVSRALIAGPKRAARGRRVPAADIETIVGERLLRFLGDPAAVLAALPTPNEAAAQKHRVERAAALAGRWPALVPAARRQMLQALGTRIAVHADRVDIHIDPTRLPECLNDDNAPPHEATAPRSEAARLTLTVPARLQRVGMEMKLIVDGAPAGTPDASLIRVIVKAHALKRALLAKGETSLRMLASREGMIGSYLTRLVRLTCLAPDIVVAILEGDHPPALTAHKLMRDTRLPFDWREQRKRLGFA